MKVRALRRGQYGSKIREPGEVFEYKGRKALWLEPVEGDWPAADFDAEKWNGPAPPDKPVVGATAALAAFDHDGDGRPGGSLPKPKPKPKPAKAEDPAKARRKVLLRALKANGVKAFAGAPIAKLEALASENKVAV